MPANFKAVVFDLDDTLYDCSGSLIAASRRRAAAALVEGGLPLTVDGAVDLQNRLSDEYGPHFLVFDEIGRRYSLGEEVLASAYKAYNTEQIDAPIALFPDTLSTLKQLREGGLKCLLLTVGHHMRQKAKIRRLGLEGEFDDVLINDYDRGSVMSECLRYLLQKHNLKPHEVLIVGDRPGEEIRYGNELGAFTAQFMHGRFRLAEPRDSFEVADYRISSLFQIPAILKLASVGKTPDKLSIVALGGGTGLPVVLEGCRTYCDSPAAIVAVTDCGRSTGRLRDELGILAPGDIRNCLVALSEPGEKEFQINRLFQYRFRNGSLEGMSLGNLLIAAMTELDGGFEKGINTIGNLLSIKGRVLPSTVTDAHISAELVDGSIVSNEVAVSASGKAPIRKVFLQPEDIEAPAGAIEAIENADIIVLGPGSLFTSVMPNILVPGIRGAIEHSSAVICYISNIVTQPGETDNFNASDHYRAVKAHLGSDRIDAVIVNSEKPGSEILEKYKEEGADLVEADPGLDALGVKVIKTDLCEARREPRVVWEKQDLMRHNPDKLGDAVCRIFAGLL